VKRQLVFIDDSGDPGFKGATSANFVMAAALFIEPKVATEVNKVISEFRKSLGWQDEAEFKFRKTNKKIIKQLLEVVIGYDFKVYAVYVDKTSHERMLPVFDKEKLYNWTVKELLKIMPLDNAYVKIDGRSSKEHRRRIASYLRREINVEARKIEQIKLEDSVKDNLIQLADLIAGSINRSFQAEKTDNSEYVDLFKGKIVRTERLDLNDK